MKRFVILGVFVVSLVVSGCGSQTWQDAQATVQSGQATLVAEGGQLLATIGAADQPFQEFQQFKDDDRTDFFEMEVGKRQVFSTQGKCLEISHDQAGHVTWWLCKGEEKFGDVNQIYGGMGAGTWFSKRTFSPSGITVYMSPKYDEEKKVYVEEILVVYAKDLVLGECSCPTPTPVPIPATPTPTPVPTLETGCVFGAEYVSDVTVPDGYQVTSEDIVRGTLEKTWRVRNSGSCSWLPGSSGPVLGRYEAPPEGEDLVLDYVRETVLPGDEAEFTVIIGLPTGDNTTGTWTGEYRLRTSNRERFGDKLTVEFVMP
ncbi:MAG TPA: NBR1-Ig-like domain-containing protein [Candidatus Bathyarchaeia archaeon]|nr:NBR1-Ig-like domain-containing protein [Candidatus Bathyarchaeia archaeon]